MTGRLGSNAGCILKVNGSAFPAVLIALECLQKIQLRGEPKFNEKSKQAASWVRNCSHGHMEFTGQSKRHTFAANVRTGNKLHWEGERGKRNGRKEAWLQVEIPQPPREKGGELRLVLV